MRPEHHKRHSRPNAHFLSETLTKELGNAKNTVEKAKETETELTSVKAELEAALAELEMVKAELSKASKRADVLEQENTELQEKLHSGDLCRMSRTVAKCTPTTRILKSSTWVCTP